MSEPQKDAITGTRVCMTFGQGKKTVNAVRDATFSIQKGEIISLVDESGSGKSTLANILLGLLRQSSGTVHFYGKPIPDRRTHWQKVQAVFQDPFSAYNQFFTVRSQMRNVFRIVPETLGTSEKDRIIGDALHKVNIAPEDVLDKYPFELSGGQMQRLLLARIFCINPTVLIADEPTSMIDACSRASILQVLLDMNREMSMTILFITHDIGLAYAISHRIFVMQQGQIVEQGSAQRLVESPTHEYTRILLDSVPCIGKKWL